MTEDKDRPQYPTRVFLWANARSCSTLFMRMFSYRKSVKVFFEPYSDAYYYSNERQTIRETILAQPNKSGCSYPETRDKLEKTHGAYQEIFAKDAGTFMRGKLEFIPRNYVHTFLIRNPILSCHSYWTLRKNRFPEFVKLDSAEPGYEVLLELFNKVWNETGKRPVLIETDDLLKNPEVVLRKYCQEVGISYQRSMVEWPDTPLSEDVHNNVFHEFTGAYFEALTSKKICRISKSADDEQLLKMREEMADEFRQAADRSMPIYKKLIAHKIQFDF